MPKTKRKEEEEEEPDHEDPADGEPALTVRFQELHDTLVDSFRALEDEYH